MDPNSARQVLRILPDSPLTVELIERAHADEAWARHPSRYPDGVERGQAEEWVQTLTAARAVLLTEIGASAPTGTAHAAVVQPARRRPSRGAVAGIVAGVVGVVALLTFAAIGAAGLATQAIEAAGEARDEAAHADADQDAGGDQAPASSPDAASGSSDSEFVERLETGETLFAFPAALEVYLDGRYDADCPADHVQGCWEMALFTEADCDTLQVQLGFTNDANALLPDHLETIETTGVRSDEATPVVFGQDDFGYGWINQVTCLDPVS